ncbi:MAG: enoyl-CoA hydratase/isomerase family protein [Cyclonatronaceae bacterium]
MKDILLSEKSGRIATITLNRPEKKNALNPALVNALDEAVTEASADPDVKVILLRAAGDVFCAGADLEVLRNLRNASYEDNLEDSRRLSNMFYKIHNSPKIVIAAVHGHAIAGGCGLVTVCDLAVAREGAMLGYSETRIGFVPAIVTRYLIGKTGITAAKKLLLTGELINAGEAARIGLVTESAADADFESRIEHWVTTFLEKTSGDALSAAKKLIHYVSDHPAEESTRYAIETNAISRDSEDCRKGIDAFLSGDRIRW